MATVKENKYLGGWTVPKLSRSGRKFLADMRVNFKYGTVFLNRRFPKTKLAGIIKPDEPLRGAFRLVSDEKPFIVFDPAPGVPFYQFRIPKDAHASSTIQNSDLVELIGDKFGFKKGSPAQNFELVPFERMNGMTYFQIVLIQAIQKDIEFKR